jgi:hypothetical protein
MIRVLSGTLVFLLLIRLVILWLAERLIKRFLNSNLPSRILLRAFNRRGNLWTTCGSL